MESAMEAFWVPLRRSFTSIQRRQDIFLAGKNDVDGETEWVCSVGHVMGLFDHDWLGMPATDKRIEMRVVDFYRRDGDKLAENRIFIDIPYFLKQQGLDVVQRAQKITNRQG